MTPHVPHQQPVPQTIEQLLQQAIAHHQSGQLLEAGELYQTILQSQPNHPEANHYLGVIAVQAQQPAAGLPYFLAALDADPAHGQYWLNYIDALFQAGQLEDARQILALARQQGLEGDEVEALSLRLEGGAQDTEQPSAEDRHEPPVSSAAPQNSSIKPKTKPDKSSRKSAARQGKSPSPQEINALATLFSEGRFTEAATLAQTMTERFPLHEFGWKALGAVLMRLGRSAEALEPMQKAAELSPDDAEAHSNLGITLLKLGKPDQAVASFCMAREINPKHADAHFKLGHALKELGWLDEAEASYRRTLEIKPDFAEVHGELGNVLIDLNRIDEAMSSYRRAMEIEPDFAIARSNLLFFHNLSADNPPSYYLAEARQYGQIVAEKVTSRFTEWVCTNRPVRLRIGFVSADFWNHPVGFFLESLLNRLDPNSVELIAYPTHHKKDKLTARIKPHFSAWKPIVDLSDEAAARLIHSDGVHVLIDLSGHTKGNRLPVFSWKPAPVQVSWLGYFATTGIAEIDYLLGDRYVAPTSEESHFTEKLWQLPESYICFTEPDVALEVAPLPALSTGSITFGCFNYLIKMNDAVVAVWANILTAVPGAKLFLKTKLLNDASTREATLERFSKHGISAERLILESASPRAELLAAYHRVDIALDPFPYPGGTTSIESLWMGVPVITKCGDRFLSHVGETIAHNAGLSDWIAVDDDDYITKAVAYASDLDRLVKLRAGLRQQVLASPLFDATRFARHFEKAIWEMWKQWLKQRETS